MSELLYTNKEEVWETTFTIFTVQIRQREGLTKKEKEEKNVMTSYVCLLLNHEEY